MAPQVKILKDRGTDKKKSPLQIAKCKFQIGYLHLATCNLCLLLLLVCDTLRTEIPFLKEAHF